MRMTTRNKGFLLVLALLITVLIAVIALGLLGIRRGSYASSKAVINSVQARALARSGINDIWVKLSNDPFFPTGIGDEQEQFSYREEVRDSNDEVVGTYTVKVDRAYRRTLEVVRLESTGRVGGLKAESSTHTIYAELSTKPGDFTLKVWQEGTTPRI